MTYPGAIKYLESFVNYEKITSYPYKESLKLSRIKNFLQRINNPQDALKCIHIAGTKGKGSTSAFVAYILRKAGFKVGLYTSPHLSDFRERIRILQGKDLKTSAQGDEFEGMISKGELTDLVARFKQDIEKYNRDSKDGPLSFFEIYTSLAFIYFKEQDIDFAVLETGLGGRLDATNVVEPLVCAITSISYEHTQKLGNTLREIAREKAGIIKGQRTKDKGQRTTVISAPQEKDAREVIRNRCRETNAKLYEVGKEIIYNKSETNPKFQPQKFNVQGIWDEYINLKIKLLGAHQLVNATVAIGVIEALKLYNIDVDVDSIRDGLYNTIWPGRCEVISENPLVVLDGAQNVASAKVLKQTIKESLKYKRLILVLGISQDKDIKGICAELKNLADQVVLTIADNPRASPTNILAKYFNHKETHITNDIKEAKHLAYSIAQREDLILVTGSLFVVGEFRNDKIRH